MMSTLRIDYLREQASEYLSFQVLIRAMCGEICRSRLAHLHHIKVNLAVDLYTTMLCIGTTSRWNLRVRQRYNGR